MSNVVEASDMAVPRHPVKVVHRRHRDVHQGVRHESCAEQRAAVCTSALAASVPPSESPPRPASASRASGRAASPLS